MPWIKAGCDAAVSYVAGAKRPPGRPRKDAEEEEDDEEPQGEEEEEEDEVICSLPTNMCDM